MFVTALLAASLAAPVPKGLKPKTIQRQLIGRWEMAGQWRRLTDTTFITTDLSGVSYEFLPDGVVVWYDGPERPLLKGRYTVVEPDEKDPEWRVTIEFPRAEDSGQWVLKEVGEDRLKVIDSVGASKDVYERAKPKAAAKK